MKLKLELNVLYKKLGIHVIVFYGCIFILGKNIAILIFFLIFKSANLGLIGPALVPLAQTQ